MIGGDNVYDLIGYHYYYVERQLKYTNTGIALYL
jgi:hypothetical protein